MTNREATDNYVVRRTPNLRAPWALFVVLDDGTEDRLGRYGTRSQAMNTGSMLAGASGSVTVKGAIRHAAA